MRPDTWKVRGEAANFRLLLGIEHVPAFGTPGFIVLFRLVQVCEFVVPVVFSGLRHVPIGRINCHEATFGHIGVILRPFYLPMQQLFGFLSPFEDFLLHR